MIGEINQIGCRFNKLRGFLASLSCVVAVGALVFTFYKTSTTSLAGGLANIPFNELINESIKGRVEFSRSLFQLALLVTAALWGLLISKKEEAGLILSKTPEMIMFLSASALLILSLVEHSIYLHYISGIYADAGTAVKNDVPLSMANVFDPNINNFYNLQIYALVLGVFVAGTTLFSAHKLKEES